MFTGKRLGSTSRVEDRVTLSVFLTGLGLILQPAAVEFAANMFLPGTDVLTVPQATLVRDDG